MTRVYVSRDMASVALGADEIARTLAEAGCEVVRTGSRGLLSIEPLVEVETIEGRIGYGPVSAAEICEILNGTHPNRLGDVGALPFFASQQRFTFARCGIIDPLSLEDYAAHGGWRGLDIARAATPQQVVDIVKASGLRGRGGAGFPTGIKWQTVLDAPHDPRFIVCNADEGDSGTFADRMLMEGDPYCIIEGMAIAAHAVSASHGYIYIRSEYPYAIDTIRAAIDRAAGRIAPFVIEVRAGAGAYICGEETALLDSIEGKRGQVRAKPPLPALKGLFGKPTVINNVLSLAAVPFILAEGAEAYANVGFGRSRGTMPVQLAGNVKHGGLYEIGFGITLGELVNEIGGGTESGRPVRAVQVGGPLGAYFPPSMFHLPFDYEAFAQAGGLIGHAGITVFDDTVDMAHMARFAMEFCGVESCGKCTPCRIGSTRGVEVIDHIIAARDKMPVAVNSTTGSYLGKALYSRAPSRVDTGLEAQTALLRDLCDTMKLEGRAGYPASCTTPVVEGMVVRTQTERLKQLRRGVMELYISDHPLDCLTCPANGDCELQEQAGAVGLRDVRYGYGGATNMGQEKDQSNPYFDFDPSKCILCSRCVRACDEVQGTFALTIEGRGFNSRVSPSPGQDFLSSECVSCGACVQACPTATLTEKKVVEIGTPDRAVVTTCAYCGVGCTFRAEMRGEELVRMVPWKEGKANHGHSCVKGRFAWGYAQHKERILNPMIRSSVTEPWREVSWEEAIAHTASEFRRIQAKYGARSVGGITSSRCTNEETFLVQKLIRQGFGNNNVDTCARVCHSPTGYGLKATFGTSAGTQDFDSVMKADVILVIGANPTDAHPVFGSRIKQRLRQGAKLIVIDPRRIDLVKSPNVEAAHHLPLRPGTNVAMMTALAHVVVTEKLYDEAFIRERCDWDEFEDWAAFVSQSSHSPEAVEPLTGVKAEEVRAAARLYATGGNGAIYYGLGVTEHSQGSSTVMAIANLAMATGNIGREGVGVNPLRGQNNVQGSCDMGSFPHEFSGYRHVSDDAVRGLFERKWSVTLDAEPGLRIPNMLDAATEGWFKALFIQGEDILQSDPNTHHVAAGLAAMECVVVQDLFLNETANYAHIFLPGSTFLEKDGTFTNAERRIQMVRKVMSPLNGYADWETVQLVARAMGLDWSYAHPSEIMDEIAELTPTFAGVNFARLEAEGSLQWPANEEAPHGTPTMHIDGFVRGKGKFVVTDYVPTDEKTGPRFPLLLTTGRILSHYNVGAQTRRTANTAWHPEDRLEIHPTDAENRGIKDGDWISLRSRAGETTLRAFITERVAPGVVYTTFHHPDTQANVITTDYSDWATNCPEYKVTAVQVALSNGPSHWQEDYAEHSRLSRRITPLRAAK